MATKKAPVKRWNWTPTRRGTILCSPSCGAGCTFEEYQTAIARAEQIAKTLGPNWKPCVWENLGWHAKAEVPGATRMEVSVDVTRGAVVSYTAFLHYTWSHTAKTPMTALRGALRVAGREFRAMRDIAAALRAATRLRSAATLLPEVKP